MSESKIDEILGSAQPDSSASESKPEEKKKETKPETKKEEKKAESKKAPEKAPEKKPEAKKAEKAPEAKKEESKKAEVKKEENKPLETAITYPVKVKVDNEVTIFANRQFTKIAGRAQVFTVLGIQDNVGTIAFGNGQFGCTPCNEEVLKAWMDS